MLTSWSNVPVLDLVAPENRQFKCIKFVSKSLNKASMKYLLFHPPLRKERTVHFNIKEPPRPFHLSLSTHGYTPRPSLSPSLFISIPYISPPPLPHNLYLSPQTASKMYPSFILHDHATTMICCQCGASTPLGWIEYPPCGSCEHDQCGSCVLR